MIASLPMYDRPELADENDRFWQSVRDHLGEGPAELTRGGDPWEAWLSPELIFSQTCGYPFRARLHGQVTLIGTPDYGLPGCPAGHYNSVFVARADDTRTDIVEFADARFAYNEAMSQSGWAAPQTYAHSSGFMFTQCHQTGGHLYSARAVAKGQADIAAIDALTWDILCEFEAFTGQLRELGRTKPTPVLPYITAKGRDGPAHFKAVAAAIEDLPQQTREALRLKSVVAIPADQYLSVPNPPPPSEI